MRLGHDDVGTEHILLALLELEPDDGILTAFGLHKATIEGRILTALAQVR